MQTDDYTQGPRDQNNTSKGDVLLIKMPGHFFDQCIAVVEEVKNWGIVGEVRSPDGPYYIRVAWPDLTYVGKVPT
jgi:hypothetical protein